MTDKEDALLKFKCLKLSNKIVIKGNAEDVIKTATKLYKFINAHIAIPLEQEQERKKIKGNTSR